MTRTFLSLFFSFLTVSLFAQDVTEEYFAFSESAMKGNADKALVSASKIFPNAASLTKKRQAIFYYKLAGIYETRKDQDKAVDYYKRVIVLEPDYYVAHLALGYLYLNPANALVPKINSAKGNAAMYQKYLSEYKAYARKALPHLEKAYACAPNEQVLSLINNFYSVLKDQQAKASFKSRIEGLSKNCVTVLAE